MHRLGGPEVLELEEVPDPAPGPNDLLVRVQASSVNRRDLWMRAGHPHPAYRVPLPAILGIDLCGEVLATGEHVERFAAGQRITINPYIACGRCEPCRRERSQYCTQFDVYHGTYAELALVPEALAIPVAADVPAAHVACFANSYITAWEMLVDKARAGPDDVVFVWAGTSGLGSAAVEIARLAGARVIATAGGERGGAVVVWRRSRDRPLRRRCRLDGPRLHRRDRRDDRVRARGQRDVGALPGPVRVRRNHRQRRGDQR
jgi:NADPH:quinone reductase-like Zn-dependent oxidoreductase